MAILNSKNVLFFGLKGEKGDAGLSSSDLLNLIYPVGSIYMSTNNTSPASFLGGTWQELGQNSILLNSITVKSTGVFKFFQGEQDTSGDLSIRLNKSLTSNPTTDEISNSDNFELIHWKNTANTTPTSPMSYRSGLGASAASTITAYMWKRVE